MVKISFRESDRENDNDPKKKPVKHFDLFFDFEKMEKLVDGMMKDMVQNETGELKGKKPLVLGFQMRFDDKGNPVIESIGNVKPAEEKFKVSPRAPLVDVIKSDKDVTVTAELPGAAEKDVKLEVGEHFIEIRVDKPAFYKRISFEESLRPESLKSNLNNGVLEVVVKRK
jgi:HSP20 family molecular chaperone IbpA